MSTRSTAHTNSLADPLAEDRARSYSIGGTAFAVRRAAPGLHVVATPIGNLGDVTLRALEALAGCDGIACEDTRISRRLLDHYGIAVPLTPYHEHNAEAARPKILERLAQGGSIALISDAGTPLVSDPGFKLVRAAREAGHAVHSAPGASSVLTALTLAGLPTDRFFFEGFLPSKSAARRARIEELAAIDATLVLFETGPRIEDSLADLAEGFGAREAAICREMTKLHEEVRRGTLDDLAQSAGDKETRGEFVVVIAPPAKAAALDDEACDALLKTALITLSVKDAAAEVAKTSGRSRRDIYARALVLSGKGNS